MADSSDLVMDNQTPEKDSVVTKILRGIVKVITQINVVVGKVMSYTLLLLLFLVVFEVFRRYILNNPSIWGFDLTLYLFGMPALLAGGWVLAEHGHVNMDLVYGRLSPRIRALLDCITSIVFFLFLYFMLTQCWKSAMLAITRHEMTISSWKILVWPIKIWIPVAAALTMIQGVAEFIKNIYLVITGRSLVK